MLALLWLLATYFGPDLDRLGSDSFSVREWELRRCNNLLMVLLLPKTHESPEVRHRMQELRSRHLKLLNAEFCERAVIRGDAGLWARMYLAPGRSKIARTYDGAFAELFGETARSDAMFEVLPPLGSSRNFLWRPPAASDFGRWLEYVDFHERVAPEPRPVP